MGMFGYMTDTETVEPVDTVEVESEGENGFICFMLNVYHGDSFNTSAELYTVLKSLKINCHFNVYFSSIGDDMESLLFHFLDDWLYKFSADLFFIPRVSKLSW